MPKVGTKHFKYTAKGRTDAKKYAKRTQQKISNNEYSKDKESGFLKFLHVLNVGSTPFRLNF